MSLAGGAMAMLFAMDIVNERASGVSLVTFSSPRVGNAAFSQTKLTNGELSTIKTLTPCYLCF